MKTRMKHWIPIFIGMTIMFCFSFFLMFRTFGYDSKTHVIKIAPKLWSDFGAHIPMIRSFSMGPNLDRLLHLKPVESPLFPGEPIRYHFGFYAIAGILEKLGMRLDFALNIPSALGFFLLLCGIWWLSWQLFKNKWISLLSILFFLCNGTLSFVTFFQKFPLSIQSLNDIVTSSRFATFGPWDSQNITAFWSLNIYTNQRHLALSYGIILFLLGYLLAHPKPRSIVLGLCIALLLFINFAAAGIAVLFLGWFFLVHKQSRLPLLYAGLFALPALLALQKLSYVGSPITFEPWYLARAPHTWQSLVWFWTQNLGLHTILIPLGLLLAPKKVKILLLLPLIVLFAAPNAFRFSADMINNHKFFNFFIIIGGMCSAYALVKIWSIKFIGKILTIVMTFFLILSGIIDFFPIINDNEGGLVDYHDNPDAQYILHNTTNAAVFADSVWFYHPANLVGRSIYSGYTYFTWSYGYDQGKREGELLALYRAQDAQELCKLLYDGGVTHVELSKNPEAYIQPNLLLWDNLSPIYQNPDTDLKIFSRETLCGV